MTIKGFSWSRSTRIGRLLAENDWQSLVIRAVLSVIGTGQGPGDSAPPAFAETGLRRCGAKGAPKPTEDLMSKPQKTRTSTSSPSRVRSTIPKARSLVQSISKKGEAVPKTSRLLAMLQSPSGTTMDAMMKVTGWQQHSVRGFLAGVVRKRLRLKLDSRKIDHKRIYQVIGASGGKPSSPLSKRSSR
jgi:hypothetical protein